MAPPDHYRIRVRPDTEWPLLWEHSLQTVLFPEKDWAIFKKPEETLEMSLDEVIDRARQYFSLDAMHAKALQQKITKLFRTEITTNEQKTVEEHLTTSDGTPYTEFVNKVVAHRLTVSKDGILDTLDEFRFVGEALVAIEQDVLEDFATRSTDPKAWKAAPASVATTIVNAEEYVSVRGHRDGDCDAQCDGIQAALKQIDFRPLLQDDILKQWLTYVAPDSMNASVVIDLLQTRYSSGDSFAFLMDTAIDPAFLDQLFVTLLQRFPDQVPNHMIAAAIFTVDGGAAGMDPLRDVLYAGKGSPLIDRYLAKTPNPPIHVVTALARAGHPAGYRFVREILTNPSSRYLQALRKETHLNWKERLNELIVELADPRSLEEYELNKIHPDRRADYLAMRKDAQQRIRTAAQQYDAHSGFVLSLLLDEPDGRQQFADLQYQWQAADPKYQPCTFHQLKAYAASFPAPADYGEISDLLENFVSLAREGYLPALLRLQELALTFDRITPYALQELYDGMELSNGYPRLIRFFADEIPVEPMAKFVLATMATRAEKDPEEPDLFVLFKTICDRQLERAFPASYHVFRRVTVQLREAERAKSAAESFGVMDAQHRYADLGDDRPLAVLQQLVVTGHAAADTAWEQIKQNTDVPNEPYVVVDQHARLLQMIDKVVKENPRWDFVDYTPLLMKAGALGQSFLEERHQLAPAADAPAVDIYAVMVDHLFVILDIAKDTGFANAHQLDATELLVGLVRDGQIQALSDADGAELVMQLRNLDVAGLAPLLDAPDTHERVLGVLTQLTKLGNTSAWGVIQAAFTKQPETYAATLKQFLEDDNFPFHDDIISLAQTHVHNASEQAGSAPLAPQVPRALRAASLYRECYDLLVTGAQADREGAWAAIGVLAEHEVGMESPAVETLLDYTSVRFPDEQQAALAGYDSALATAINSLGAVVTDSLPELDPVMVRQAQQLADRDCVASLNAVNEYEALRAAMQEVSEGGATAGTPPAAVAPAAAAATGSTIGGDGPASSAAAIRQAAHTLYASGATPTEVAHALHTLKTQGMTGNPAVSAAAVHQLTEAILAPAMAMETMHTALAILVELAVHQHVPAAQQQLSTLIDTCKQAVAHHADGNPDFWLSLLLRMVELGNGQPVEAVNTLGELTQTRPDLGWLIGNILSYLHVQFGVTIPASVQ